MATLNLDFREQESPCGAWHFGKKYELDRNVLMLISWNYFKNIRELSLV